MRFTGGTHSGSVDPAAFAMRPGLTMRYDRPAPALLPFVTAYNMYHTAAAEPRVDWFLPSGAMLCFTVETGPIDIAIARRRFATPPGGFVMGPTGHAFRAETHGGALIGVGLSPLGWARLTNRRASDLFDTVAPMANLLGAHAPPLMEAVAALDDDGGIKPLFDEALATLLAHPHPDDALIAATTSILLTDGVTEVGDAAARLGIDAAALRRVSLRYFGMLPKLLLRRARFLRSLMPFLRDEGRSGGIDSSYHDVSHFLRDANAFLGTTPRRFMLEGNDFLRTSVRARLAVLGSPAQALHDPAVVTRAAPEEIG